MRIYMGADIFACIQNITMVWVFAHLVVRRVVSFKRFEGNYAVGVKASDVGRERICKLIKNLELAAAQKLCHENHAAMQGCNREVRMHILNCTKFKLPTGDKKRVMLVVHFAKLLQTTESYLKAKICCEHRLYSKNSSRGTISTRLTGNMWHEDDSKHLKIDTSTPSEWPLIFNELVTTLQQPWSLIYSIFCWTVINTPIYLWYVGVYINIRLRKSVTRMVSFLWNA